LVVVGVVEATQAQPNLGKNYWRKVTVRVTEVLKGTCDGRVEFGEILYLGGAGWPPPNQSAKFIFCLVEAKSRLGEDPAYGRFAWALAHGNCCRAEVSLAPEFYNDGERIPLGYTVDNVPIYDPGELIAYARDYCSTIGETRPAIFSLGDEFNNFVVPRDARTEQHAREWARSANPDRRSDAISALLEYPNPTNVEILKSLLTDPKYIEKGEGRLATRFYYIRTEATKALDKWHVSTNAELEDPFINYNTVPWNSGVNWVIGILVMATATVLAIRFKRIRRRFIPLLSAISCFLLGAAWARSLTHVDEIVMEVGRKHHFMSFDGNLQYIIRGRSNASRRFIYEVSPLNFKMLGEIDLRPLPVEARRELYNLLFNRLDRTTPFDKQFWFDRRSNSKWQRAGVYVDRGTYPDALGVNRPYLIVQAPYLWLLYILGLPLLVSAALTAFRKIRSRIRRGRGRCSHCGYDLRGGGNTCPECGWRTGLVESRSF
jgi:hypothetical protein